MRHPNRRARKKFPVTAERFREARLSCFLTVEGCAELLRVSVRTIQNWESGAARPPYAAYKLMRVLRGGKVLGPEWRGFTIRADRLNTPEGHTFEAGDLAWWSLLVRQAREFRHVRRALREAQLQAAQVAAEHARQGVPAVACAACSAPAAAPSIDTARPGSAALVDRTPAPVVGLASEATSPPVAEPETPSSNRGYSETERAAFEAVPRPQRRRAATLPKAGVAAKLRAGVPA